MNLLTLPKDIREIIWQYLSLKDLVRLQRCSKLAYQRTEDQIDILIRKMISQTKSKIGFAVKHNAPHLLKFVKSNPFNSLSLPKCRNLEILQGISKRKKFKVTHKFIRNVIKDQNIWAFNQFKNSIEINYLELFIQIVKSRTPMFVETFLDNIPQEEAYKIIESVDQKLPSRVWDHSKLTRFLMNLNIFPKYDVKMVQKIIFPEIDISLLLDFIDYCDISVWDKDIVKIMPYSNMREIFLSQKLQYHTLICYDLSVPCGATRQHYYYSPISFVMHYATYHQIPEFIQAIWDRKMIGDFEVFDLLHLLPNIFNKMVFHGYKFDPHMIEMISNLIIHESEHYEINYKAVISTIFKSELGIGSFIPHLKDHKKSIDLLVDAGYSFAELKKFNIQYLPMLQNIILHGGLTLSHLSPGYLFLLSTECLEKIPPRKEKIHCQFSWNQVPAKPNTIPIFLGELYRLVLIKRIGCTVNLPPKENIYRYVPNKSIDLFNELYS